MSTIAMLGGLGATHYIENPSAAARAAMNAIYAAKSVDEVLAVKNGLPNMGLSTTEAGVVSMIADDRITDLKTPFYNKAWFWYTLGIAGAAWIFRKQIMGFIRR
jgi:hypothetical protein